MRLYDKLLAQRGSELDYALQGGLTKLFPDLQRAQCFQMSKDISLACESVCNSRPSSILSAIEMVRAPYPSTWLEWVPNDRAGNRENNKPVPIRVGSLLVTDDDCQSGWAMLAWEHRDGSLMINPLGWYFNWRPNGEPALVKYAREKQMRQPEKYAYDKLKYLKEHKHLPDRWKKFEIDDKEFNAALELEMRAACIPLDACMTHLQLFNVVPGSSRYESLIDDLSGELPFIEAFLLLLNSRNRIVEQMRDDFTRLNKARGRLKRPPFKEFINTTIRMNRVQGNRAIAAGMSREAARQHLVRGHFKIRRSGVFWWTPHIRSKGDMIVRREYDVR
jgi:hypothetical protein